MAYFLCKVRNQIMLVLRKVLLTPIRSCQEDGKNKWNQVFISDYVRNFYIPEFELQPDRYKSHFISRTPDFCRLKEYCECGRQYAKEDPLQEEDLKLCSVCDDEFMNYVKRFATFGVLNEHLNNCGNVGISTENGDNDIDKFNEPTDFSTLNVKELRAELAVRGIKCPSKAKKSDLITLLEQYEAND